MIEKLSNAYAPSGREEGVRNLISEELLVSSINDYEFYYDNELAGLEPEIFE